MSYYSYTDELYATCISHVIRKCLLNFQLWNPAHPRPIKAISKVYRNNEYSVIGHGCGVQALHDAKITAHCPPSTLVRVPFVIPLTPVKIAVFNAHSIQKKFASICDRTTTDELSICTII